MIRLVMIMVIFVAFMIPLGSDFVRAQEAQPPPGPLPATVYRERRERVMKEMGSGIAVLYARGEEDRDGYRQDSDFYYLTGINDPESVLVLAPEQRRYRHRLYLAPRNPEAERWTGERAPLGHALLEETGFDLIRRTPSLGGHLINLLQTAATVHLIKGPGPPNRPLSREKDLYNKLSARWPGLEVKNLFKLLPGMRSIKEERELERMQKAIDATLAAHRIAAGAIRPGVEENWVESLIMVEFKKAGAVRPAFGSIVGAGDHSTILHYPDHDQTMRAGSLVVVDIGAEYGRYAADVTRTYPVDGRFTPRQRKVYETVLRAQNACLDMVEPGIYVEDLQAKAEEIIKEAGFGDYFIHGIGHFVGLDVHDAGLYNERLEEGMVITIEPGIYIPEEDLGVRIEDEVLVTARGAHLLTAALPRDVEGILGLMQQGE